MARSANKQSASVEEAKAIVRDAERYRYLRDNAGNEIMRKLMEECRPEEWDKLVDQERSAHPTNEKPNV